MERKATVGSTLATGAGASIVKGAQQKAGIDKLRGERFGLQDKRLVQGADVSERQNIKIKPLMLGKRVTSRGTNKFVQVLQVLHNLENRTQSFAERTADRLLTVDTANLTRDTANRQMELRASIETAKIASENNLAKFRAVLYATQKLSSNYGQEKNALTAETNEIMRTGNTIKMQGVAGRISAVIATVAKQYQDVTLR